MNYKCQYCNRQLVPVNYYKWTLSCPKKHVHIRLNQQHEIDAYRFYVKEDGVTTHSVEQINLKDGRQTIYCNRYYERHGKNILKIEKFFPLKVSEDGTLLVNDLFDKLRMFILFS